ncbi:Nitrogen assimilation regulatory protein [Pirellulimonas nuda]|uniref:Nitrogen assimilation regulatory protein n=1 Tax=Pirellulimonas nuda TaxID=2528009 RepID=A0A518DFZ7_9BACT|nr:sigma 54-interacting transcriptional regulator [Pirellulimonas nuda]QDU90394.1 Nitrogen assimilation regulatory protein [Pirellulimonas nuda]
MNLSAADRAFLAALSRLAYSNPFTPERIALEAEALGDLYQPQDQFAWSRRGGAAAGERVNVKQLAERAEQVVERLRAAHAGGDRLAPDVLGWYVDAAAYCLYYRHMVPVSDTRLAKVARPTQGAAGALWRDFARDYDHFFGPVGSRLPDMLSPAHLFACLFQIRRAFFAIYDHLLGESRPAAQLRANVWLSIFTHDMRRYRRSLYARMRDLATLVTGPTGAGKELVARAIGLSQYIAFSPERECFTGDGAQAFLPLNLSAMSPTLIESELFGHCRGAFTGATADRVGWFEACPGHGAVFLDEVGELDEQIQVKLLRVLQDRTFNRLGDPRPRVFEGRIIAATNRDLAAQMAHGSFRTDFYYRLCSDRIEAPSLRDHLADRPESFGELVRHIAQRAAGDEADGLADEVQAWADANLPPDYPWPGNIRELEQCVRSVLIRKAYAPPAPRAAPEPDRPAWLDRAHRGELTAAQLLSQYAAAHYARTGSYEQTAAALGLDRRTVRAKVEAAGAG